MYVMERTVQVGSGRVPNGLDADGPPATMTVATIAAYGTPPDVSLTEVERPRPGEGQVAIQVAASSLNALDWHLSTGTPYLVRLSDGFRRPRRTIPGADVAGVVIETGTGVTDFAIGDRVFGEVAGGGCAPVAVAEVGRLARIPDGVDMQAAAATPVAGLTALQALVDHGRVEPGDRVLINGGAGGVGTFAVQIAVALDARVTAVCSTPNVAMLERLGAHDVVDYRHVDVVDRARAAGESFDVIVDLVGNHAPAAMRSILESDGTYVVVSGSKTNRWLGPAAHLVRSLVHFGVRRRRVRGFVASPNREDLERLATMLAEGTVVPEIHRTIDLGGVGRAIEELGGGHTPAKIVVRPA